jgi:hypothetical protein
LAMTVSAEICAILAQISASQRRYFLARYGG